jgi:two-component system, cell cycle response regulator DivK
VPPQQTVLLVQADADNRELYAESLRQAGFRLILASTARDALRAAGNADAIVTGILLPGGMDGVEMLDRLKCDERTTSIPVIVLTSCCWPGERARAEGAGCALFLGKPCGPQRLLDGIHGVLAAPR